MSALHSTGLPDHVEWPNRRLEPLTDYFIAVAPPHARYLAEKEGCPAAKVRVIPNGVDTSRFYSLPPDPALRRDLGLPVGAPVATIVAALRPEKNHSLFLRAAALVKAELPTAHFLVVGDGALRPALEAETRGLGLEAAVHFLGTRADVPEILGLTNVVVLSSHMEANPVSILEALACERPVVATRVGSVGETVHDDVTGYLATPGDEGELAAGMLRILTDKDLAARLGRAGRDLVVNHWSLERMVWGYEDLLAEVYQRKAGRGLGVNSDTVKLPEIKQLPARSASE